MVFRVWEDDDIWLLMIIDFSLFAARHNYLGDEIIIWIKDLFGGDRQMNPEEGRILPEEGGGLYRGGEDNQSKGLRIVNVGKALGIDCLLDMLEGRTGQRC